MLSKKLFLFRQCKFKNDFATIYGNIKEISAGTYNFPLSRFSTCKRKLNISKESATTKNPPEEQIKSSKLKYIAAGSVVAAGSAFVLWYSKRSKQKQPVNNKKEESEKNPVLRIPSNSSDIPDKVPYLLIGGGTASFAAFRSIKSNDATAKVLVIAEEPYYPYMRPPLSKDLLLSDVELAKKFIFKQWNGRERSIFYEAEDFYLPCEKLSSERKGGVSVARGWKVVKIDPYHNEVTLNDGKKIKYDKCLIATGSRPKVVPPFEALDEKLKSKISTFKTIDDFSRLFDLVIKGNKSIAIIGGSFLGSELASSIAIRGKDNNLKVTQIIREEGNLANILPRYLSSWLTGKVRNVGVDVVNSSTVEKVSLNGSNVVLSLNNGNEVKVDHVILAEDFEPVTDLADVSGLEIHPEIGGYVVNTELAARSDLYVAGDCACFYDIKFGRRRIGHHDHAVVSGRLAGENMIGAGKPYWHQSMFWSDIVPDVGFEGIGIVNSSLPTVGIFAKLKEEKSNENESPETKVASDKTTSLVTSAPKQGEDYNKGVIFYLQDDVIVGIVLWNVFSKMSLARQILKEPKKYDDLNEVAKLFNLHEDDEQTD